MGLQPAFGGPVSYKKCVQILIFVVTIEGPFLIFVVDSSCIFPVSLARPPKKGVPLFGITLSSNGNSLGGRTIVQS